MAGRPLAELILNNDEIDQLESWTRRRKTSQALAFRSRIILECARAQSNTVVAERLSTSNQTVCKWRSRFLQYRLDGLMDAHRSGTPRSIDDKKIEDSITRTLESKPKNATHWSTRTMAAEVGVSQKSVQRIWKAFGLQPHRQEAFKLSTDPLFVEKTRDIVGL